MEIIVINKKIGTRDIVLIQDIKDIPNHAYSERDVGFIIYLIDGSFQVFKEFVIFGASNKKRIEETKLKYKALQNKVEQKWKEDSHNLPTFNL